MKQELRRLITRCEDVLKDSDSLCYVTRGSELQSESIKALRNLEIGIVDLKDGFVEENNEKEANLLLALESLVGSYVEELQMWISIKRDEMGEAWGHLIDAQMKLMDALGADSHFLEFENRIEKLYAIEKNVFPPQMFMSTGGLIKQSHCSICSEDFDVCNHIPGRPYMGMLCARVITEIELEEVSLVTDPANKHCRILTIEEDGITKDYLTRRSVE